MMEAEAMCVGKHVNKSRCSVRVSFRPRDYNSIQQSVMKPAISGHFQFKRGTLVAQR
jgi:hypothetical protein